MKLPEERADLEWSRVRRHDVEELWDQSISPHVASAYAARMATQTKIIEGLAGPGGRILDVGCAQGTLGLLLAERGFRVALLDVRATHIAYAQARHEVGDVEFYAGLLSDAIPPRNDYDVVVCTEVLEHVQQPATLLSQLGRKARPGGAVFLTTPNADYFLSRLPSFGRADQRVIDDVEPNSADGDAHRFLYTREELFALVRGVGMKVEAHGVFLPFWLEGHLKTRYAHRLLYRRRGKILRWPGSFGSSDSRLARRVCSSQWLVARLP